MPDTLDVARIGRRTEFVQRSLVYAVPDQQGKTVVVTGANSGTGKETATRLAGAGAHVILSVRSAEKGETTLQEIRATYPNASLEYRLLDLSTLASVNSFANEIIQSGRPLHGLANNAGVMAPPKRNLTVDGFELQFGTNFLGHFALTLRLLPLLLATPGARVATMSSTAAIMGSINFDDLTFERRYISYRAYAQSKLADLLLSNQLAKIANDRSWDLLSVAAHPGFTRTNLMNAGASIGRRQPKRTFVGRSTLMPSQGVEQGAEPLLYALTSADAINGGYYGPNGRLQLTGPTTVVKNPRSARRADAARLWQVAESLTGVTLESVVN